MVAFKISVTTKKEQYLEYILSEDTDSEQKKRKEKDDGTL